MERLSELKNNYGIRLVPVQWKTMLESGIEVDVLNNNLFDFTLTWKYSTYSYNIFFSRIYWRNRIQTPINNSDFFLWLLMIPHFNLIQNRIGIKIIYQ